MLQTPPTHAEVANGNRAGDVAAAAVSGVGHEVEAFVDHPVAVVVEAVAGFDAGVRARCTRSRSPSLPSAS
jgi:hypothetical protein